MSQSKYDEKPKRARRVYPEDLKREAVQMYLDGLSATSIADRLGLSNSNLVYNWKEQFAPETSTASVASPDAERVRELQSELARVTRERDVLKKALSIFSQNE